MENKCEMQSNKTAETQNKVNNQTAKTNSEVTTQKSQLGKNS